MFSQLLSQPPIPLNTARKGCTVPASVEAVVMKALSRNPSDRYPDVVSFATALRTCIEAPVPELPRGSLFSRVKSLMKRGDQG
jgi:eukaryotic-like serine/threonine-protein kinase